MVAVQSNFWLHRLHLCIGRASWQTRGDRDRRELYFLPSSSPGNARTCHLWSGFDSLIFTLSITETHPGNYRGECGQMWTAGREKGGFCLLPRGNRLSLPGTMAREREREQNGIFTRELIKQEFTMTALRARLTWDFHRDVWIWFDGKAVRRITVIHFREHHFFYCGGTDLKTNRKSSELWQ